MIDAIKYEDIVRKTINEINLRPRRIVTFDSVEPAARDAMAEINAKIQKRSLIVVMFCNPQTPFCQSEILGSLNYLHYRSDKHINIFCCGFGVFPTEEKDPNLIDVIKIDGKQWSYSDKFFVSAVKQFEKRRDWKFSGENELLLLDVTPTKDEADLSILGAIVCNLEKMKKDNAFSSVRAMLEDLIRYVANEENANVRYFSNNKLVAVTSMWLKDLLLGILPIKLLSVYSKAENYAVRQI
ncbi:MAG: hypothetical protein GY874_10830 [Desulfobacteraceae bacterium]|nr:hypothetical protein [Desulfobacteraceae bacterium]